MVDSIAVNTPSAGSGAAGSKKTSPNTSSPDRSASRLRSAKRLKLSPASDFSAYGDGDAVIMRPQSHRDYVGESKSLMEKIRQARDFSTISTRGASQQTPANGRREQTPEDKGMHNLFLILLPNVDATCRGCAASRCPKLTRRKLGIFLLDGSVGQSSWIFVALDT